MVIETGLCTMTSNFHKQKPIISIGITNILIIIFGMNYYIRLAKGFQDIECNDLNTYLWRL